MHSELDCGSTIYRSEEISVVGSVMQRIRDRIRALEDRKEALLQEQQSLLVEGAISNRRGNGNNGGN
ncbi:hypothetical protein MTR_8g059740 [Medicago truncatula]|uniref:Uncharacterized protein n=1 Tax=Medicago truncatula TaxID=3880 RepID=G7LCU6_MEDTR|nr:hypothetical protein MTR_8g059740 [Medicago truncatula]